MLTYNQSVSGQKDFKNSGEVIGSSNFGAPLGVAKSPFGAAKILLEDKHGYSLFLLILWQKLY